MQNVWSVTMTDTTIETINGKQYTVVWHIDVSNDISSAWNWAATSAGLVLGTSEVYATALPPLPRYPKPEDAKLLYRYMAEGLEPMAKCITNERNFLGMYGGMCHYLYGIEILSELELGEPNVRDIEIAHCTNEQGEKVEVAIDNDNS